MLFQFQNRLQQADPYNRKNAGILFLRERKSSGYLVEVTCALAAKTFSGELYLLINPVMLLMFNNLCLPVYSVWIVVFLCCCCRFVCCIKEKANISKESYYNIVVVARIFVRLVFVLQRRWATTDWLLRLSLTFSHKVCTS